MVVRSPEDLRAMLIRGLTQPDADKAIREAFMRQMFAGTPLDGRSGERVAKALFALAQAKVS